MRKSKAVVGWLSAAAVFGTLTTTALAATIIQLPNPTSVNTGRNGDFLAYSAELNEFFYGIPQPKAANGQISDELVVYSHNPAGPLADNNSPQVCSGATNDCVDSPFPTPTGAGKASFDMDSGNEPPSFDAALDKTGAWDITLDALKSALNVNGQQFFPVFMLDQNQEGTGVSQDVYGWGLVTIGIPDGAGGFTTILGQFEFCGPTQAGANWGNAPTCNDKVLSPDFADTNNPGEFVQAVGEECIDAIGTVVPCDGNQFAGPFDNNLGTNTFEFQILSQGLNALLQQCWTAVLDCTGAVMSVEFKLRNLNDGDDTVAIFGAFLSDERPVALPSTLLMLVSAAGIGGFATRLRRRFR